MPVFKRIDAQDVSRLVLDIERQGYAVIEHFLSTEQLESARDYVLRETHKHNSEYFALHGIKSVTGSLFEALSTSVRFRKMLADVQEAGLGRRVPEEEEIFPAVRCLQGKTGLKESNYFHYDATALTALVPVFIPNDTDQCGDFIMFPNTRRIRSSVAINIIEKALIQNPLSQKFIALLIKYNLLKPIKIKLVPGNLYIFWDIEAYMPMSLVILIHCAQRSCCIMVTHTVTSGCPGFSSAPTRGGRARLTRRHCLADTVPWLFELTLSEAASMTF